MARLVFLAVLLAAATYASADEAKLTIKSCTDTNANECNMCGTTPLDYTPDGVCHESGESGYKATCEAAATEGGKKGKWTLELFTDKACTNPNTAAHTISSDQQCFDGNSITVNVKKITTADKVHTVKLNLCPAAKPGTACTTDAVKACAEASITVAEGDAGTKCGEPTEGQKYYYTAAVKENKLTLALYTTKGTCTSEHLPVFKGEDMEASETATEKSCKTFQQKLNAVSCVEPETTTTASTTDNSTDNSSNSSTNDDTNGSAAVSAVLALLAAACAVWMM